MRTEPSYSDIIKLGTLGNQNEMALTQTFFNLIYGKKSTSLLVIFRKFPTNTVVRPAL